MGGSGKTVKIVPEAPLLSAPQVWFAETSYTDSPHQALFDGAHVNGVPEARRWAIWRGAVARGDGGPFGRPPQDDRVGTPGTGTER